MMKRGAGAILETAAVVTKGGKHISIAKAHHLLGHTNCPKTIKTTKHSGWGKLKDSGGVCHSYAKANV